MTKLLAIVGSLRKESINRRLLRALVELCPEEVSLVEAPLVEIPLYNADLDEPASVAALKSSISDADGLVLVTPEFNYGIPGVLKNAIDWVSRPAYKSVLAHKPVTLLGASPGPVGTARAQAQLKEVLSGTVSNLFPYPEVTVGGAGAKFDSEGRLVDENTREHLKKYLLKFSTWVDSGKL